MGQVATFGLSFTPPTSKGNQVNIPELECRYLLLFPSRGMAAVYQGSNLGKICGNTNKLGDASRSPGKSSLFFLTSSKRTLESDYLERGSNARQSITLLVVSGALLMALENPRERMIFASSRTDNRSRSPR
jgi:hypothetical protein